MTAPNFPPEVIEKAARAIFAEHEPGLYAQEDRGTRLWRAVMDQSRDAAHAVLAAMAEEIDNERYDAWHEKSYQRGMAEGARQVEEAMRAFARGDLGCALDYCDPDPDSDCAGARLRAAAREAVARIEKGAGA